MKIISLFNHKGGVSKTTTAYHLGWILAELGHKTLIVDTDPQCNLTALALGAGKIDNLAEIYRTNKGCNLYEVIKPIIDGTMKKPLAIKPLDTPQPNLKLLCGHLGLAEAETQISVALTTSTALPIMRNVPGALTSLLRNAALKQKFEYVIIDMSPSVGALNQCTIMGSDAFIVPTSPDFFCSQAITSMTNVFPRWNKQINAFRTDELQYRFPDSPPKFIGFISQKYRPRKGVPAKSFQQWIDIIDATVNKELIPTLTPENMTIDQATFKRHVKDLVPYNLSKISDFNSLIAQSQKYSVPAYALTDRQIEQGGEILKNMKKSRDKFKKLFVKLAKDVVALTSEI